MMNNWINSYILCHESEGFAINTDILETNLINIIILIGLLVYVLGTFLKENLSSRQDQIISSIQDCEKRLKEAKKRLSEAEKQWNQAQILFEKLKSEAKQSKRTLIASQFNQASLDYSQRFENTSMVLRYREQEVINDITKQVSEDVFVEVVSKIKKQIKETDQSLILDKKINSLGGSL